MLMTPCAARPRPCVTPTIQVIAPLASWWTMQQKLSVVRAPLAQMAMPMTLCAARPSATPLPVAPPEQILWAQHPAQLPHAQVPMNIHAARSTPFRLDRTRPRRMATSQKLAPGHVIAELLDGVLTHAAPSVVQQVLTPIRTQQANTIMARMERQKPTCAMRRLQLEATGS